MRTGSVSLITPDKCMRCSLCAHIHKTTPDVLYGDTGQLWVNRSDDFWVWLLEVWPSEPPRKRFGRYLLLCLVNGTGSEVVRLSGCDLEHFWRDRCVWMENKVCREGDWRTL